MENIKHTSFSKIIFLFLVFTVGLFIFCASKMNTPEESASFVYVCCLFSIPFVPFIFSIFYGSNIPKLHSSIAFFSALSIIFYLCCWCAYLNKWSAEYLWLMPLFFSFILSGFTILITWLIFEKKQQHSLPPIILDIEKIKDYPFLTLCLFLVIFVSITYLFGFSFAFNDKYLRNSNKVGLYINPKSQVNSNNKDNDELYIDISASKKPAYTKINEIFNRKDEEQRNTFITHLFNDEILTGNGKVKEKLISIFNKLDIEKYNNEKKNKLAKIITIAFMPNDNYGGFNDFKNKLNVFFKKNKDIIENILYIYRKHNNGSFLIKFSELDNNGLDFNEEENSEYIKIIKKLTKLSDYENINIKLTGYANIKTISDNNHEYKSNFELSEARTNLIYSKLLDYLSSEDYEPSITWNLVALGSAKKEGKSAIPSVEVQIKVLATQLNKANILKKHQHSITLLEYIYFSIYTITTTGYGDIFPVSHEAKFLSALGNLLEMYFIVIFFNIFLAETVNKARKDET